MKKYQLTVIALLILSATGCASITKGSNQAVKIETYNLDNQKINDATCIAKNDRGTWTTTTTGTISASGSRHDLFVKCEKDGQETGLATMISRVNAGMFGNIIFGGGIGATIDHFRGTAYSYPDWIRVIMGKNLMFDRKRSKGGKVLLGEEVTAKQLKQISEDKIKKEKALAEQKKDNEK